MPCGVAASDWAALDSFASANGLLADVPEPGEMAMLALASIGIFSRAGDARKWLAVQFGAPKQYDYAWGVFF